MADENDVTLDDQIEYEDEEEEESSETQDNESESNEEDQDSDEVVVSIGEQAPSSEEEEKEAAPQWVKDLRKESREKDKRIRELEKKIAAPVQQVQTVVVPKPTLADCDYDEEVFDQKYSAWLESKRQADEIKSKQEQEQRLQQEEWQKSVENFNKSKSELKFKDYKDAEETVEDILSQIQQGILIDAAKNPALVVYAIGKNPEEAKRIASIKNPVKFAVAIAELESKVKMTQRKAPPPPEKAVRGNVPVTAGDSKLARLEAEADKTGDRSALVAYKKQLKAKAA